MTCKLEALPNPEPLSLPPRLLPASVLVYTVSKSESVVRRNETSSDIAVGRMVDERH